jgi:ABC-2 type transport system permease protein
MTSVAINRWWGTARITALSDLLSAGRIAAIAARLAVQVFLVVCLWRALYADTATSAGLTQTQAVTYAVLAVLAMRIRAADRWGARDTVVQHVEYGTIVYWFIRPLSPPRYYFFRQSGDMLYGLAWASIGYLSCFALGVVSAPASASGALSFMLTFLLGQTILYYLVLLTDQMAFWIIKNDSVITILVFAQNLLSGSYAALWYFPHWFQVASTLLPFQYTVNIPLSFYVGRLTLVNLPIELTAQAAWLIVLSTGTHLLWRRAAERVLSQGG